uniref:DnaB-like helicase C-terminal domain-containing protein n=1 Tax=Prevotella sp. TaxID=59823 RepID=UPI003FED8B91
MTDNQQLNKREKPRYYATDFPEILEKIPLADRVLYLRYQEQFHGIGKFASKKSDASSFSDASSSSDASSEKVTLAQLRKITQDAMKEIHKQPVNIKVTCPTCGKKHCYVKRSDGRIYCFSCEMKGQLDEMKSRSYNAQHGTDGSFTPDGSYAAKRRNGKDLPDNYVPMSTDDYKEIDAATRSILYPIYPFSDPEEEARFIEHFHPANVAQRNPKAKPMLPPQRILSLQGMVQRYIQAMNLSPDVIRKEGVMCAFIMQPANDAKSEDPKGVEEVPAIVYCNHLFGKIINAKFRSVQQNPVTGEWSKGFTQISPTKPCAPYGIDSINDLRPEAGIIRQIIITEGEKDRLTLMSCGFPYVLSVANGAATNIAESHEAFEEWILQAEDIVICGDSDRPGRMLVKSLINQYPTRAKVASLPSGKKDISEVYEAFGRDEVARIISEAKPANEGDVYDLEENADEVLDILMGNYDHGYEVGMGKLTDGIFHPTSDGGLIILTGRPNSGKTDFLNCMMAHLMYNCNKRVAFFSFEKPIKGKHVREIARIALGVENTETMDGNESPEEARLVNRHALKFLMSHMVDFDTKSRLPDSKYITELAESEMRKKKQKIDFLVIDPYVFINVTEGGSRATETEKVKLMLTRLQQWSRAHHVWTVVVAHPRIQYKDGHEAFPPLDLYSIAGSAQWANLADYLLTVTRVNKPQEGKTYSIVEMLKVRDQEFCRPGKVYYMRQPCGRYDERASEEECIAEVLYAKVLPKDEEPWEKG